MTAVTLNTGAATDTSKTEAPEGHDAAMVAKVDAQQTAPAAGGQPPTEQNPERPAWLDPKFNSGEDLAKAYAELSKKLGTAPAPTETKPAATGTEIPQNQQQAQAAVEGAGLDFEAVTAEFTKEGKLSDATYDKLAKGGINRAVADSYIAGQQALANQVRAEVFSAVGGEEQYTDLVNWAKDALSPAEINAYNNVMNSRDTAAMKLAVDGLRARQASVVGTTPKLLNGGTSSANQSQGDVFRSTKELTTAMADPRYQSDPAYREDVRAKLSRSNIM